MTDCGWMRHIELPSDWNAVVVEVKSVDALTRLQQARLLTYLKLAGYRIGMLVTFNVVLFKQGIRRLVL